MAKICLIRHAESIANTQGIYQGQTYYTGLSVLGCDQAKAVAKRLSEVHFDSIITSPLLRAQLTAGIIAEKHQLDIVEEIKIIETNHGKWEGLQKDEVIRRWPDLYYQWRNTPSRVQFIGGEAFVDILLRVRTWWNNLVNNQGSILVVSHDNIIRIIIAHVLNLQDNYFWCFRLNPTGITLIESENNYQRIITINDSLHLHDSQKDIGVHAL